MPFNFVVSRKRNIHVTTVLTMRYINKMSTTTQRNCSTKQLVTFETTDNICLIGINRPEKRNCVNHETALQLVDCFEKFESRDSLDAAVLHGIGGTFCAGYDLSEVAAAGDSNMKIWRDFLKNHRPMGPSMMQFSKPVIAAVTGYCVAGGLELASMCDLRCADKTAVFGVFCRRFGVPLIDGGTIRLPKLIGMSRAMDMILTGRPIDAATAFDWGLVNRLSETGTALGEALKLARSIAYHPKECMRADRRSAYYSEFDAKSYRDAFDYELTNAFHIIEQESKDGASKFVAGVGRSGQFGATVCDKLPKHKL